MIEISPVDVRAASDTEYAALSDFQNRVRAERLPDDPPIPTEERVARWRAMPDFLRHDTWLAWAPGRSHVVAGAEMGRMTTDENAHLAQLSLDVLPEQRCQGLARRLLAELVPVAEGEGRRLLVAGTTARVPAGAAFMARLGARKGMEAHTNQLVLAAVDRDLVARWQAQGRARAAGFTLGLWDGPYPEGELAAIARLYDVMNDAPMDDLEVEDMHFTPERLRQMEAMILGSGARHWILYAREAATGQLAGFTEVTWHPNRPAAISQGNTGVFPEHRGRGLGRWLKAAMLDKILAELPAARYVRTGNADSNAAMLGINRELGFEPYLSETFWQVETARVRAYLDGPHGDPPAAGPG